MYERERTGFFITIFGFIGTIFTTIMLPSLLSALGVWLFWNWLAWQFNMPQINYWIAWAAVIALTWFFGLIFKSKSSASE